MSDLSVFCRVGHQGRLRPVFDGAMAALLGRMPTAHAVPWMVGTRRKRAALPTLQKIRFPQFNANTNR
jgi:hypothetical protein